MVTTPKERVRRIESRQNGLVKDLRRAAHQSALVDGYAAIEGVHLIEEAIRSRLRFSAVFFASSAESRMDRLVPQLSSHVELLELPDQVFASAMATETPQGVAALVRWPKFSLETVLQRENPLLLAAFGIQDPGNLGTMIRSADAFGADAVLLGERTVSEFNGKTIRASAGSIFRLPAIHVGAAEIRRIKDSGIRVAATSSHKGTPIDEMDFTRGTAVLIGSEGAGIAKEYMAIADELIRVPHQDRVESLNAAIAASVILYEAQRQRKTHHGDTETQRKSES